jgi:hypothetical protein
MFKFHPKRANDILFRRRASMRSIVAGLSLVACSSAVGLPASPPPVVPLAPQVPQIPFGPHDSAVASADVSILYPIDAATDRDQLIGGAEVGQYGPLLGADLLASLGSGGFSDLRLVSVRLDPCAAHGNCGSEVRVVWQPVLAQGDTLVDDGAVHAIYAVPADELQRLLEQILTLKAMYGAGVSYGDSLGVQPILAGTGLDGGFARGLHALWLAHLGQERITRATVLAHLNLDGDFWQLKRFDRQGDAMVAVDVVGTSSPVTMVAGSSALAGTLGAIGASVQVMPTVPAMIPIVSGGRPSQATPELSDAFAAAIATLDPTRHNSEDTDCLSCHVAEGAHSIGVREYGFVDTGAFASARSLAYVRAGSAITNFHAFGYLGTSISVMQRTANESALVADRMQAALPR